MFDTDLFAPVIEAAAGVIGTPYGRDDRTDVALRVLADHGRAFSMLVADGVLPANEGRGYVLRRVVRRAVLAARRAGVDKPIAPALVQAATEVLGEAYPTLAAQHDLVVNVVAREEAGFDRTLRAGLSRLEEAFAGGDSVLAGDIAFTLHDTHGFPVELTEELARDVGVSVDRVGFDAAMAEQRARARSAAKAARAGDEDVLPRPARRRGAHAVRGRGPLRTTRCRPASWPCSRVQAGSPRARPTPIPTCGRIEMSPRSRSSSTAPRSTPRAAGRSATPAPSSPRSGIADVLDTQYAPCRVWSCTRPV